MLPTAAACRWLLLLLSPLLSPRPTKRMPDRDQGSARGAMAPISSQAASDGSYPSSEARHDGCLFALGNCP